MSTFAFFAFGASGVARPRFILALRRQQSVWNPQAILIVFDLGLNVLREMKVWTMRVDISLFLSHLRH